MKTCSFDKNERTLCKTFRKVNWIDIAEDDTVQSVLEKVVKLLQKKD